MPNRRKTDLTMPALAVLIVAAFLASGMFTSELSKLNNAFADLTKIEYLSSSTQRLVRLVLNDQFDERLTYYIDEQTSSALNPGGSDVLSVMDSGAFMVMSVGVVDNWTQIMDIVMLGQEEDKEVDKAALMLAADNHYYQMTSLSDTVGVYTSDLNGEIIAIQSVITVLLTLVGLVVLNSTLRTHTELKQSKELAEVAQIDMATGLFNRSKCQELFKQNSVVKGKKHPAMIVFDLNDLKKTNDVQGHRMGDELIHAFANMLKNACDVHIVPPFIGRYGGDEFIVYYEDVTGADEVRMYLKELDFLAKEYNDNSVNFKVSYACGFSVSTEEDAGITTRQLFDKADEAMYANKVEMKRVKEESKGDA